MWENKVRLIPNLDRGPPAIGLSHKQEARAELPRLLHSLWHPSRYPLSPKEEK